MPSPWIVQWAGLVAADATVLDVAAGGGRHTCFFADRGHKVTAIDRDISALAGSARTSRSCRPISRTDRRGPCPAAPSAPSSSPTTCTARSFPRCSDALAPGGVLLYETFMEGNERFGEPSQPEFLLKDGELLELVRGRFSVVGLRGPHDQRAEDGDGPAHRRAQALAIPPPSRRPACAARARRTSDRASATAPSCAPRRSWRSTSAMTKPAFSPPASASTSPHGATAIEWP